MANYIHQVFLKGCLQVYNMNFSSVIIFCFVEDVFYKRQQFFFFFFFAIAVGGRGVINSGFSTRDLGHLASGL